MIDDHARELLDATHQFPGAYTIKAIGQSGPDFVERVVRAARGSLAGRRSVTYTVRTTPHGRHTAVTLEVMVESAEEVLTVYAALQPVEGLRMLL